MKSEKIYNCLHCNRKLILYEEIWDIDGEIYCEECAYNLFHREINETDIEKMMPEYLEG